MTFNISYSKQHQMQATGRKMAISVVIAFSLAISATLCVLCVKTAISRRDRKGPRGDMAQLALTFTVR